MTGEAVEVCIFQIGWGGLGVSRGLCREPADMDAVASAHGAADQVSLLGGVQFLVGIG